jgi:hypothetical protein
MQTAVDRVSVTYTLSVAIALLMAVASAAGLFAEGLYRDNAWATAGFRGNDLVTLAVVVPLMVAAGVRARAGSLRSRLVWLGTVAYALYNYAFYLFGAAFNALFLVYAALVTLSVWTLLIAIPALDVETLASRFSPRTPVRWVAASMLLISVFLGGMWGAQSLRFIFTGDLPQTVIDSGIQTSIVFALDLALLMPAMATGAILLWRRRPWGCAISAILMIKGTAYTLALLAMSVFSANAHIASAWDLAPGWAFFFLITLLATGAMLRGLRPESSDPVHGEQPRHLRLAKRRALLS